MKNSLSLILIIFFSQITISQALYEGSFVIDPYYGGPNFGKTLVSVIAENTNQDVHLHRRAIGPAGIRLEYLLDDSFGIGVDVIYNSIEGRYKEENQEFDTTSQMNVKVIDNYAVRLSRLRIQARFNYHFAITNPAVDVYLGVGGGSNTRFFEYTKNGEDEENVNLPATLFPVSMRLCGGFRYYFNQYIGLNAEFGLGGPVISGGLSLNF